MEPWAKQLKSPYSIHVACNLLVITGSNLCVLLLVLTPAYPSLINTWAVQMWHLNFAYNVHVVGGWDPEGHSEILNTWKNVRASYKCAHRSHEIFYSETSFERPLQLWERPPVDMFLIGIMIYTDQLVHEYTMNINSFIRTRSTISITALTQLWHHIMS